MRLILEAHPDIACYDETKGYAILQNSVSPDLWPARLVGFKLPCWTEQITMPVLFDEGVEGHCPNFYRGEKMLFFLHRDVRDTIASMLKLKAGASNWCQLSVARIIAAKVAREPGFRERYAEELSIIASCHAPQLGLAALYWKYKTDAYYSYRSQGLPVLAVCYEDLVSHPQRVLQTICRHLGITFHVNLLRHNELPHAELFPNGLTVGNTNPKRPISTDSVGQWVSFFSERDLALIDLIAGDLPSPVTLVPPAYTPAIPARLVS